MGYTERKKIIRALEKERKSKVITLITSDRLSTVPLQGIQGQIGYDQVYQVTRHLKAMATDKPTERVDLLIYSRGGDTGAAWPLVNVIRQFPDISACLSPCSLTVRRH